MIVINFKDTGISGNDMHAVLMVLSMCGANGVATALITHQKGTSPYCLPCHSETSMKQAIRQICWKSAVYSAPSCPALEKPTNLTHWQLIVVLLSTFSSSLNNFFSVFIAVNAGWLIIFVKSCSIDGQMIFFIPYKCTNRNQFLFTTIKSSAVANKISNWLYYSFSHPVSVKMCFLWHWL